MDTPGNTVGRFYLVLMDVLCCASKRRAPAFSDPPQIVSDRNSDVVPRLGERVARPVAARRRGRALLVLLEALLRLMQLGAARPPGRPARARAGTCLGRGASGRRHGSGERC